MRKNWIEKSWSPIIHWKHSFNELVFVEFAHGFYTKHKFMVLFYSVCIRFFVAQLFLKVAREIKCPENDHCCPEKWKTQSLLIVAFAIVLLLSTVIFHQIFKTEKDQRGRDPWKSNFFLLRGVCERGWRGSEGSWNPPRFIIRFIINKKINFLNLLVDKG